MPFGFEEYERMADLARRVRGKVIISVNDIPAMRRVFVGLSVRPVDVRYTLGCNRGSSSTELIICNWWVVLLAGGDKRTQDRDIKVALDLARNLRSR